MSTATATRDTTSENVGSRVPKFLQGWNLAALIFIGPAILLLAVFMVYPAIRTIVLSFEDGLGNYVQLLTRDPRFLSLRWPPGGSIFNNILWLLFYTGGCIVIGLIVAVMATRVRYERIVKAIVFLPMAIAATALGVIWRFVYSPDPDTGLLNAVLGIVNVGPVSWLGNAGFVNTALIIAGIWGSAGFAVVILSAALKGISSEILEAARVDGASEAQIFRRIIVPMLSLPISVIAVTLTINVVKLFDLVYIMTEGGPGNASNVIAVQMYQQFSARNFDYSATVAVVMLVILIPVMVFNIRRFRSERVVA
ncbi:MAG: sugar ABC transporter permease [Chloroflexota bacterium]|jgi:alpha-glucoside transport system permease protein|nr:sugar ABC transporter permease [Chloroflexota bacterium]